MEGRLIFLHRLRRTKASGRWPERGRPASRGRLRKERGHIRSRSPRKDSQEKPVLDKADARSKTWLYAGNSVYPTLLAWPSGSDKVLGADNQQERPHQPARVRVESSETIRQASASSGMKR